MSFNWDEVGSNYLRTDEQPKAASKYSQNDYLDAIDFSAEEYGVDKHVLAGMIMKESGFSEDVIRGERKSRAGAIGIAQFMPDTAKRFGIDPTDPIQSIMAAGQYLRANLDKFGGDYDKAVAGYNWGENRKVFDQPDWKTKLPPETADYVEFVKEFAANLRGDEPKSSARQELPKGVTPSDAGAGRGGVGGIPVDPSLPMPPVGRRGTMRGGVAPFAGGDTRLVEPAKPLITPNPLDAPYQLDGPMTPAELTGPSKSPEALLREGLAERDLRNRVYGTGSMSASTRGPLSGALDSFNMKPLDQSLAGAALETFGDALRGAAKVGPGLAKTAWDATRAGADIVGADGLSGLAAGASNAGAAQLKQLDNPNGDHNMTGAIQSLGTAIAGALTGGVNGAIALGVGQSAGDKYSEARNAGFSVEDSAEAGVVYGFAEYLGERIGMPSLGRLVSGIAQRNGIAPLAALREAAKQQGEEQVTQAMQSLYDKFGAAGGNPNMTFDQYLDQAVDVAKQTAIMTAVAGAGGRGMRAIDTAQRQAAGPTGADYQAMAQSKGFLLGTPESRLRDSLGKNARPVTSFTEPGSPSADAGLTPIVVPVDKLVAPIYQVEEPDGGGNGAAPDAAGNAGQPGAVVGGGLGDGGLPAGAVGGMGGASAQPAAAAGADVPGAPADRTAGALKKGKLPNFGAALVGAREAIEQEPAGAAEPVSATTPAAAPAGEQGATAAPAQPAETWMGRRGNGFASEKDALPALVDRRKRSPQLSWKVEPLDSGRVRLAGYERTAIDTAAAEAATSPDNDRAEPTQGQKDAGNYKKGHVSWNGLQLAIENPAGSERSGVDPNGQKWSVQMPAHYGYVKRTEGADGDHVDIYMGPNQDSKKVFVVDQVDAGTGKFDEHKAFAGTDSIEQATKLYDDGFSDGKGPQRRGAVTEMGIDEFKAWVYDGVKTDPVGELNANPRAAGAGLDQQSGGVDAAARRGGDGQRGVDQVDTAGLGDQPDAPAGAAAVGGPTPARTAEILRTIEDLRLKKGQAVKLEVVQPQQSESVATSISLAKALGRPVMFVRAKEGKATFGAVNFRDTMVLVDGAADAPIALVTHEALHGMPSDIKADLIAAIMPHVSAKNRETFNADFDYAPEKVDEEIAARLAQQHSKTPEFWRDLAAKMGEGKFARFAKHVLDRLDVLVGRFKGNDLKRYATEIEAVRDALTTAYAETQKRVDRTAQVLGETLDFSETPAFLKWFGDSKVVDKDGKPKVVYHGTEKAGFNTFDPDRAGTGAGRDFEGLYFTNSLAGASTYSGTRRMAAVSKDADFDVRYDGDAGNYAVYLKIENPYEVDFGGRGWDGTSEDGDVDPWLNMDRVVQRAKKAGHDGVIASNVNDEGRHGQGYGWGDVTYIAFKANQVKSATENSGAYDPTDDRIDFSERAKDFTDPEARTEVSTTQPRGKKSDADGYTQKWVIDASDIKGSPKHVQTILDAISSYNTLSGKGDAAAQMQEMHDVVVENLLWLHDLVPADVAARAKLWYDGANKIATDWVTKYGVDLRQASGVLAALSPQMDWFKNVSLAERVINTWKNRQAETWTPAMTAWVESWVGASKTVADKAARGRVLEDARRLEGQALFEMEDADAAKFIRVFDETYQERAYRLVTPEGGFGDYVTTSDDGTASVTWGGFGTIEKAVAMLRDGSFRNISEKLGDEHKVRNFYNNIIAPGSKDGHVTIDTHAVAAALVKALSGTKPEVMHNFGGAGSNAATGASGTYGLFADAYRDAAVQRGVLPREMQSITWEAVRALFPASIKDQLAPKVDAVWDKFKAGKITRDQARKEIHSLSGGIRPMAWEGSDAGKHAADGGTSFNTELATDPADRDARTLEAKDAKDRMQVTLSAATNSIEGVASIYAMAKKGDAYAHALLQDMALDSLRHLMAGTSARIVADRATGLYGGSAEPSLGLTITFNDNDRDTVLAALAKFGDNFNQEQIHVRQPTKEKPGHEFGDGSYATPVWRWSLDKGLSQKQIQKIIDKSGLYGLTFGDDFIEAYYVGDPHDGQTIAAFEQGAERVTESLGSNGSESRREVARLWPYGHGGGAIGYDRIAGDVAAGPAAASETARRVAEYLNRVGDKPGRVKAFDQAPAVAPEQRALQEQIARVYESLPDNDLANPRVRRAYAELAKEVVRQFKALPIKTEIRTGDGEPYNGSPAMRRDVLDNNHLFIYGTTPDTFGPPGVDFTGHPLLGDSGLKDINGTPLLYNDLLRAVHDYFAHTMSTTSFGPLGEEAAWKNHMSSTANPWARWALTSETRGQNSWVNFRPGAEGTDIKDRSFAPQKAALMPIEYSFTGEAKVDAPMKQFMATVAVPQRVGSKPVREVEGDFSDYGKEKDSFGREFIGTELDEPRFKASDLKTGTIKSDRMVDAMTYAVDSEYPIINAARKAGDRIGDAWKNAVEALPGRTQDAMRQEHKTTIEPLVEAMGKAAKSLGIDPAQLTDAYGVYRLALHAGERNDTLRRNGSLKANPSGMSEAEAQQWLDFFKGEPDLLAALQGFDPLLRKMQKRTDEIKMKAGLLTQADIDARSGWAEYINLQGDPGMADKGGRTAGGSWNDDTDREALGRDSLSANPVINTVKVLENAIRLAELARVKKATYEFANAHGPLIGASVKRLVRRPIYDANGNFVTAVPNADKWARDAVVYRQGDVEYHIAIGDVRVSEALKRLNGYDMDPAARIAGRLTSGLGRLYTQFSPHFPLVNWIRDVQQQVSIIMGSNLVGANGKPLSSAKVAWHIVTSYPRTFAAAIREVWGDGGRGKYDKALRELVANGGTSGLTHMFNDHEALTNFVREVKWKAGKAKGSLAFHKFVDVVQNISEVFELTNRAAVYSTLRDAGVPIEQAANTTKNLMNFNKAGVGTRSWIGNLFMFIRPSITDVYKTSQMLRTKRGLLTFAAMYTGAVAIYAMLRELSGDDDDDKRLKNMDTRSASERRSYYILPVGGKDEPVRIPVGFGLTRLAWGLATATVDSARNPDYDWADAVDGVFKSVTSSLSPMQISDINILKEPFKFLSTSMTPTVLLPIVELTGNKTKGGQTIRSANEFDARPSAVRGYSSTPKEFKDLAQFLYDSSDGKFDIAPENIPFLMRSYGGGPANTIINGLNTREKVRQGEPLTGRDIPIVQAFTGPKDRYPEKKYRELTDQARQIKGRMDDALARGTSMADRITGDEKKMLLVGFKEDIDSLSREEAAAMKELRTLQVTDYNLGAKEMKVVEQQFRAAKQGLLNAYNEAKGATK